MYSYSDFDEAFVRARVQQFAAQVARRLDGTLSEDEFRPFRLMNGLYLQLHAYMLRVAIPYGTLSAAQMRQLAQIADRWDQGYGHFTTRQNIQFNWPRLEDVPDILAALADVQMHAIQTSGNCIRNVTSDAFAGAAADEVADPRPLAELLRQWSTDHPEFQFLPRKFKIAVIGSPEDRAVIRAHDIGLRLLRDEAGTLGAEVWVGGGLGRTPLLAHCLRGFVPLADLLPYLEAILGLYNALGRRDNKYKARIKITLHEMGVEEVRAAVEARFVQARAEFPGLDPALWDKLCAAFAPPPLPARDEAPFDAALLRDPGFAAWAETALHPHRAAGYAIVTVSLKPQGGVPGDATSAQMRALADLAELYSASELRVSHQQNIILPHVARADLPALYAALVQAGLHTANQGLLSDIIACPGMDYCSLATARSIPLAQRIATHFAALGLEREIGALQIKISGCINACGHHHVGHIGILGLDRAGVENYQVTLGGDGTETAAIGARTGPGFEPDEIVAAIERLMRAYLKRRLAPSESFLEAYRRLGADPFIEALYAKDNSRHAA